MKEYFPNGNSALTYAGMRQTYIAGMAARKRYIDGHSNFLDEETLSRSFRIGTSDVVRTIESANSFVQGFTQLNNNGPKISQANTTKQLETS